MDFHTLLRLWLLLLHEVSEDQARYKKFKSLIQTKNQKGGKRRKKKECVSPAGN